MNSKFKVGQRVLCIDGFRASDLTLIAGKTYTISHLDSDHLVYLEETKRVLWRASRFQELPLTGASPVESNVVQLVPKVDTEVRVFTLKDFRTWLSLEVADTNLKGLSTDYVDGWIDALQDVQDKMGLLGDSV